MQEQEKTISGLVDEAKEYLENRVEYLRLVAVERASRLFADIITQSTVIITFVLAFLFGSVTLAIFLGEVIGRMSAGFGCVALLYLAIALVVLFTKDKYIEKGLINFMVRKYFSKHAEEAETDEKNV